MSISARILWKVSLGSALLIAAPDAWATPITFRVAGSVSFVSTNSALPELRVGDPFAVRYTFESTAVDSRPADPTLGTYGSAISEVRLRVGSFRASYVPDPDFGRITVWDAFSDLYEVDARGTQVPYGSLVADLMSFSFRSTGFGMLSGDALPSSPVVAQDIALSPLQGDFALVRRVSDSVIVDAIFRVDLRSFTTVPEVGTASLLGVGLMLGSALRAGGRRASCRRAAGHPLS